MVEPASALVRLAPTEPPRPPVAEPVPLARPLAVGNGALPAAPAEDTEKRLKVLEERVDALQRRLDEVIARQRRTRRRLVTKLRVYATPRLWSINHYPPRPLEIPAAYGAIAPAPASAPTLSITTPSYNQGRFIGRTIDSVLDQGYPRLQYIVQDSCSTDETGTVLERYAGRDGVEIIVERDGGQADAVVRGLARSTGEIMAYLNADDMLLPGTLAYVAGFFARHPEIDVVYGHRVIIDGEDREIGRWVLPPHSDRALRWADYLPQETMFWRRRLWEKVGGIDCSFGFALDWDLIIRFIEAGARFRRLPRFLGAFRVHDSQKTQQLAYSTGAEEMRKIRERVLGHNPTMREIHRNLAWYYLAHLACHFGYRLRWLRY